MNLNNKHNTLVCSGLFLETWKEGKVIPEESPKDLKLSFLNRLSLKNRLTQVQNEPIRIPRVRRKQWADSLKFNENIPRYPR